MSLSNSINLQLKRFSKVPVYVGARESVVVDSVSISLVKMDELLSMYEKIYAFTYTIWRDLPTPPEYEPAFVIV